MQWLPGVEYDLLLGCLNTGKDMGDVIHLNAMGMIREVYMSTEAFLIIILIIIVPEVSNLSLGILSYSLTNARYTMSLFYLDSC